MGALVFADPAFQRVWDASDAPVANGSVQRSWLWGPTPIGVARDFYVESSAPDSYRLVQFFDKARMEITYPDQDANSIWYVTNGLLVKELVSGQLQAGDSRFNSFSPARIPVAGDLNDFTAPTYASFSSVATLDGASNRASDETGTSITRWIDQSGAVSNQATPTTVTNAYYEPTLGHNIPDVLWNWINDPANGMTAYGSWVYPMGYPITEPYWLMANVGGTERAILVQLFERRILTYTPGNAPVWQVEMGNVGRAYLSWFRRPSDNNPIWSSDGQQLAFTTMRVGNQDIYTINADGSNLTQVTSSPYSERVTYWLPNGRLVLHRAGEQVDRFVNPDGSGGEALPMGFTDWSPDGAQLAYPSGDDQSIDIRVRNADGSNDHIAVSDGGYCNGTLSWSPDSQMLAYCKVNRDDPNNVIWAVHVVNADGSDDRQVIENLTGTFWVERVSWSPDSSRLVVSRVLRDNMSEMYVVQADGSGSERIDVPDAFTPAWSPAGDDIVFGMGNGIHVINQDGSNLRQLTNRWGYRPTWSPAGDQIAYLDGGNNLAMMNADGSNQRVIDVPALP